MLPCSDAVRIWTGKAPHMFVLYLGQSLTNYVVHPPWFFMPCRWSSVCYGGAWRGLCTIDPYLLCVCLDLACLYDHGSDQRKLPHFMRDDSMWIQQMQNGARTLFLGPMHCGCLCTAGRHLLTDLSCQLGCGCLDMGKWWKSARYLGTRNRCARVGL